MTKPEKPAKAPTKRKPATWTVFEQVIVTNENHLEGGFQVGTILLVEIDDAVIARTGSDACWKTAETILRERSQGPNPPKLLASRNGTAHGLTEARPYALKATVERVK